MKYNKMKFICSNIFNGIGIFLFKGRGDPKKYFGGGGGRPWEKDRKVEGSYNFQITLLQIPLAPHTP